ncbi:hypothetical protein DCO17_05010 [Polynucleobacter tropicus]|uniref:Site-specific integrase n=1 Tax=Polynucleobacter tropicus TaxID=1743174 RepID=A0A6M9PPW5_9BURK|nr:site-specific integrase [Polynucleobacter tropicus]QKM64650.1 hypothetical protein DCO17_05010 [Polynucleobacter tropicus]
MASIQKRGSAYRARITRQGKSTLCATFYSRNEALAWARELEAKLRLGIYEEKSPPVGADMAFRAAAEHYIATHSIHKRNCTSETGIFKILIKRWGDLAVSKIDKQQVLALRDELLNNGRSSDTINHYFNAISKLFQMLEGDWDLVLPNPIKGIKRMPPSAGRTKRITPEMETQLLLACNLFNLPSLRAILIISIETGMRRGETMSLKWEDVDLVNRKLYLHTTKNGEARQIPLTKRSLITLKELEQIVGGFVFPITLDSLRCQFKKIRKHCEASWVQSGINPFKELRFHDFRHEAISRLSDAGLNVIELSCISGHKTLAMLKRYTHPSHQAIFAKLDLHE